jgi:hypothetical protein
MAVVYVCVHEMNMRARAAHATCPWRNRACARGLCEETHGERVTPLHARREPHAAHGAWRPSTRLPTEHHTGAAGAPSLQHVAHMCSCACAACARSTCAVRAPPPPPRPDGRVGPGPLTLLHHDAPLADDLSVRDVVRTVGVAGVVSVRTGGPRAPMFEDEEHDDEADGETGERAPDGFIALRYTSAAMDGREDAMLVAADLSVQGLMEILGVRSCACLCMCVCFQRAPASGHRHGVPMC